MRIFVLIFFLIFFLKINAQPEIQDRNSVSSNQISHTVKPDETLFRISKQYSVSVEELMKLNNLQNDIIRIGQKLIIPENKINQDSSVESNPDDADRSTITIKRIGFDQKADSIQPGKNEQLPIVEVASTIPEKKFSNREYFATPLEGEITIDGITDEAAWKKAMVADNFIQRDPVEGAPITQLTEVRVLYSNSAIYVSAIMHDTNADSILHQLGNRDEADELNSDQFKIGIDPYNKREAGYVFVVSASGVQSESFNNDLSFDAVWKSAASCIRDGWIVEMKIPYSAIRFPAVPEQTWAIQFARVIRRNREYDQWALTPKNQQNSMLYWGTMKGIKDIDPPLRLSLTPYVSFYSEKAPVTDENGNTSYENSYSYSGGADLKWGINESFTVDLTLLPDFSQVQSDNKVKNLSAYETFYDENRPFFKEGTELFTKGDLLYTRRIGRTPEGFYSAEDNLQPGETVSENPDKAKLLNAAKLSGRTQGGLGIGLLNAITDNTYAVIRKSDGSTHKILTEPFSNYNLFIFDQQLKNNSGITLVNTNVTREGQGRDANVTVAGGKYENPKHQYQLRGSYSESHVYEWQEAESGNSSKQNIRGQKYNGSIDKISGVSWYGVSYGVTDNKYDKNDLGYLSKNDFTEGQVYYTFNKFNPFWKYFKQGNITFYVNRRGRMSDANELEQFTSGMNFFLLFHNNWSIYTEFNATPLRGRDYDEPRIAGHFYKNHEYTSGSLNFTTDYNKKLAFDFGANYYYVQELNTFGNGFYLVPMLRLSDKLNIKLNSSIHFDKKDVGFAYLNTDEDTSFFGRRDIVTVTNTFSSRYIFKNDMSLTLVARHYWSKGNYENFKRLETNGELTPIETPKDEIDDHDFNSNYLTVDVVYNWQFAPGSSFLVTYKNQIYSDSQDNVPRYFDNLKNTFSEPQTNSISIKVLYYLDYQYLKKNK
jgi:murein DD-endopeptidase MepM/ murein hydrolase activator NlpD